MRDLEEKRQAKLVQQEQHKKEREALGLPKPNLNFQL